MAYGAGRPTGKAQPPKNWFLKAVAGNVVLLCVGALWVHACDPKGPRRPFVRMSPADLRLTGAVTEEITKGRITCLGRDSARDLTISTSTSGTDDIRLSVNVSYGRDHFHASVKTWADRHASYHSTSGQGITVKSGTVTFANAPFYRSTDPRTPVLTVNGSYECP